MEIRPFRGWRYAARDGDVSRCIAPPYDILSAADKDSLLAACPSNIVGVDLPVAPAKEAGPDEIYAQAAARLRQWVQSGVLAQDGRPAIYAYEQTFSWAGRSYSRRALLAGVRATPLGRDVIPHEHTFAGPKADRLKLTQATRMQISPIFGFYEDRGGKAVDAAFGGRCCPALHAELRGVTEKLWVIDDDATISRLAKLLAGVPVFIADGHHRYTTQLGYRDELLASGKIGPDHEANFVLFALVARDDAGLLILPTHRMISGLSDAFSLDALAKAAPQFEWKPVRASRNAVADADGFLRPLGPRAMAFVAGSECAAAVLKDPGAMAAAAPGEIEAWRQLDVAILQKLIIERAMDQWKAPTFAVEYSPDGQTVLDACAAGRTQLGVLLQSTPLAAVEAIARAGAVMPHKSTYFYPKLATGMVLKPLE